MSWIGLIDHSINNNFFIQDLKDVYYVPYTDIVI
jgi:hypothetical protein